MPDLKHNIKEKLKQIEIIYLKSSKIISINEILDSNLITKHIKLFFTSNQLSQLMDETNPLSEITHKRKISCFGIGAIDKKRANINIREIHTSHFGKICPIETTEGKNAGLILSLAKDTKLNKDGFLETPFY